MGYKALLGNREKERNGRGEKKKKGTHRRRRPDGEALILRFKSKRGGGVGGGGGRKCARWQKRAGEEGEAARGEKEPFAKRRQSGSGNDDAGLRLGSEVGKKGRDSPMQETPFHIHEVYAFFSGAKAVAKGKTDRSAPPKSERARKKGAVGLT